MTEKFIIENTFGFHARPAMLFSQLAMKFKSKVLVKNLDNGNEADAKSILSMLCLVAPKGTEIEVNINGPDETQAMECIRELINNNFNED